MKKNISRPTEDAALARCKSLQPKVDLSHRVIELYKQLYGPGYLLKMPREVREYVIESK